MEGNTIHMQAPCCLLYSISTLRLTKKETTIQLSLEGGAWVATPLQGLSHIGQTKFHQLINNYFRYASKHVYMQQHKINLENFMLFIVNQLLTVTMKINCMHTTDSNVVQGCSYVKLST